MRHESGLKNLRDPPEIQPARPSSRARRKFAATHRRSETPCACRDDGSGWFLDGLRPPTSHQPPLPCVHPANACQTRDANVLELGDEFYIVINGFTGVFQNVGPVFATPGLELSPEAKVTATRSNARTAGGSFSASIQRPPRPLWAQDDRRVVFALVGIGQACLSLAVLAYASRANGYDPSEWCHFSGRREASSPHSILNRGTRPVIRSIQESSRERT